MSGIKNREGRAYEEQKCHAVTKREVEDAFNDLNTSMSIEVKTNVFSLTKRSIAIQKV